MNSATETQRTQRKKRSFIKRLFGSRRSPRRATVRSRAGGDRRGRCVTVRATLIPEKMLVAGDVTVEVPRLGGLLIKVGSDLVIAVDATDRNDSFGVRMWSTGGRVPRSISNQPSAVSRQQIGQTPGRMVENLKSKIENIPPVRLGPGGDYVRDWPEKKATSDQPSAVSN